MFDVPLFLIFAAIAVACAINLVVQTHPISSALSLVGVMGSLAVLYLLLGGGVHRRRAGDRLRRRHHGAVHLRHHAAERRRREATDPEGRSAQPSRCLCFSLPRLLGAATIADADSADGSRQVRRRSSTATPPRVGRELFTRYLLPFEVTSILILIAILGAVVLARKEI